MGVAVLHPQDCLKTSPSRKPILSPPPKMKFPNPNPKPSRNTRTHPNRSKQRGHSGLQNGSHPNRPASSSVLKPQVNKLVMGQVKILKRGEQLAETKPDRQPKTVVDEFRLTERVGGLYAGSSMLVASPPPSSVPLPAFVTKKIAAVRDATSDLRKMLRLDFS